MRVLYVNADRGIPLDGDKGASVHVRQTVNSLAAAGIELLVLATRRQVPARFPCPVIVPDLPKGEGTGAARAASARLGALPLPPGSVDLIYERYSLWSTAGVELAQRLGVPLMLEVNAPLVVEAARYRDLSHPGLARRIERRLFREARAVLPVSTPLADYIAARRGTRAGIDVTPNAVDTSLFRPAPPDDEPARAREIVFVGSLKRWHGCSDLLSAMALVKARVPTARLTIVGDGPERAALEAQAIQLELGASVRFSGAITHEEIPGWLMQAGTAVAPYPLIPDFYFSPLKLGEYLASGLPTVTTVLADYARWIHHGESALLTPPGDTSALAAALIRLCEDPALRQRLGRAGRRVAERHLSLAAATARLIGRMERCVAEHREALRRVS